MEQQKDFDPKKILKTKTEKVVESGYNPKDEDTAEYQKVRDSIWKKGLRGAIVVRNHPHTPGYFMVIDGHQRLKAAKELGIDELYVYNEGDVDDKEAKEMTLYYQVQVPFNRITEAYLVTEMVDEFGVENLEVPYTEAQIVEFQELANFDFSQYEDKDFEQNDDGTVTFSVKLSPDQFALAKSALDTYEQAYKVDTAEALVALLREGSSDRQS